MGVPVGSRRERLAAEHLQGADDEQGQRPARVALHVVAVGQQLAGLVEDPLQPLVLLVHLSRCHLGLALLVFAPDDGPVLRVGVRIW